MTKKVYKTARGKAVDMGTLRLQNEKTRAVGNMGVNARGDRIDAQGNVIDSKSRQFERRIQKQTNVTDTPVQANSPAPTNTVVEADPVTEIIGLESTTIDTTADTNEVVAEVKIPKENINGPAKGLAGAMARSKTAKSEAKDPKDLEDDEEAP